MIKSSIRFCLEADLYFKPALMLTSYMTVSLPVFPELLWRFQELFHRKPLAQCLKYGKSSLRVSWKINCIINNPSFPLISLKPWAFHAWLKLFCLLSSPEASQIVYQCYVQCGSFGSQSSNLTWRDASDWDQPQVQSTEDHMPGRGGGLEHQGSGELSWLAILCAYCQGGSTVYSSTGEDNRKLPVCIFPGLCSMCLFPWLILICAL